MKCPHRPRARAHAAIAVVFLLGAGVAATAQSVSPAPPIILAQTATPPADAPPADVPRPASAEQLFVQTTAETARHLSEASRLAIGQAQSSRVRELAQQIATDQGQIASTLESLSRRLALPLPTSPVSTTPAVRALVERNGGDFDRAYVMDAHAIGQRALRACEAYLENGRDPDLRAFAGGLLPILRSHLNQAQELATE